MGWDGSGLGGPQLVSIWRDSVITYAVFIDRLIFCYLFSPFLQYICFILINPWVHLPQGSITHTLPRICCKCQLDDRVFFLRSKLRGPIAAPLIMSLNDAKASTKTYLANSAPPVAATSFVSETNTPILKYPFIQSRMRLARRSKEGYVLTAAICLIIGFADEPPLITSHCKGEELSKTGIRQLEWIEINCDSRTALGCIDGGKPFSSKGKSTVFLLRFVMKKNIRLPRLAKLFQEMESKIPLLHYIWAAIVPLAG